MAKESTSQTIDPPSNPNIIEIDRRGGEPPIQTVQPIRRPVETTTIIRKDKP